MRLTGVVVRNAGVDWADAGNCYWRHRVARREAARIVLHGQAEFEASHVVLSGDQTFEVGPRCPPECNRCSVGCLLCLCVHGVQPAALRMCKPQDAFVEGCARMKRFPKQASYLGGASP